MGILVLSWLVIGLTVIGFVFVLLAILCLLATFSKRISQGIERAILRLFGQPGKLPSP